MLFCLWVKARCKSSGVRWQAGHVCFCACMCTNNFLLNFQTKQVKLKAICFFLFAWERIMINISMFLLSVLLTLFWGKAIMLYIDHWPDLLSVIQLPCYTILEDFHIDFNCFTRWKKYVLSNSYMLKNVELGNKNVPK